jgi:hypothetical protein
MDEALRELSDVTRRVHSSLDAMVTERRAISSAASSINVNAGGVGGWIAAWIAGICCAAMLASGIVFVLYTNAILSQQHDQISRMQDYLTAIYTAAPQLKPKE